MTTNEPAVSDHRRMAVELNNSAWSGIEAGAEDRIRLLYQAYAAAYHWIEAGGLIERCRAEHLLSRAALHAGDADLALLHARRCQELLAGRPPGAEPWDAVFAFEALARALAASGEVEGAAEALAEAERALTRVDDVEDRAVAESVLESGPWHGLR